MLMEDRMLFGEINEFAIEVGRKKQPKKFRLRFWIEGQPMGVFVKAGDLATSVRTFEAIRRQKDFMYLPLFEGLSLAEIHAYTIIDHSRAEELDRLEQLVPLYKLSFFGIQFTHTTSEYLLLYKEGRLHFLWKNRASEPLRTATIAFSVFCAVFEAYSDYCKQQGLLS